MDILDDKSREKILFNIWKSRETSDPELFKKLTGDICEFRTRFKSKQFRLFAFWDKSDDKTLVIATHGFVKKSQKIPKKEIKKAEQLRRDYLANN
ncbi:MAG: type II toxin-antitoxin system RelE/ParE family toxin [Bacteroidota bacterium]